MKESVDIEALDMVAKGGAAGEVDAHVAELEIIEWWNDSLGQHTRMPLKRYLTYNKKFQSLTGHFKDTMLDPTSISESSFLCRTEKKKKPTTPINSIIDQHANPILNSTFR